MKRLILILSFLICYVCSYGQTRPVTPGTAPRSNQFTFPEDGNLSVRNNFLPPRFADTTEANVYRFNSGSFDSLGRIIFTLDVMGYWGRVAAGSAKKWERIGSGGGDGGIHAVYNGYGLGKTNDSTLFFLPTLRDSIIGLIPAANTNLGSGFRWLVPSSQGIKTMVPGLYLTADSTTNANAITPNVDTTTMFPQIRSTIPASSASVVGVQGIKNINSNTVALEAPAPVWYDPNNLLDKSGNNNHLIFGGTGIPALSPSTFGAGIDGYVFEAGEHAQTEGSRYEIPTGNFSFELRVKREVANLGVQQTIFGVWKDTTVLSNKQYRLYFNAANNLIFQGTSASITSSSTIADGSAHTIAIVYSGGSASMYIDGTRVAGPTAMTFSAAASQIPFTLGDITDFANATGGEPYSGSIGDFRYSNIARYSGASYVVPTTALSVDTSTRVLLNFSTLAGTYKSAYTFQSNILTRTGFPQAKGGWANPDGFFRTLDNKWAFTASAYDSTLWTVWVATSTTLAGPWTVNSVYLQHPYAIENELAGNGTVLPWKGKYYHWYHTAGVSSLGIRMSSSYNLYDSFPQGVTILNPNNYGFGAFVDPYVRPSSDGTFLEMWFVGSGGTLGTAYRSLMYSTSLDGTNWSIPIRYTSLVSPGFTNNPGEPAVIKTGNFYMMWSDGSRSGVGRNPQSWWSRDRLNWFPSMRAFGASGAPYISAFDVSSFLDTANNRMILLFANSENTLATQPTASDIGMTYVPLTNLDSIANPIIPIYGTGNNNNIAIFNSANGVGASDNFRIDTVQRSLQLNNEVAPISTTTPYNINLGSTLSSVAGQNPKVILYRQGGINPYGVGVSPSQLDLIVPSGSNLGFYSGATRELLVTPTLMTYDGSLTLNANGTTPPTLSVGPGGFGSGGITFFNATYGIQQQSSELRLIIPASAKVGINNGTSERFSFLESGIARIGTVGGGQIDLYGSSGIVSILPGAAAAGTYNFRFPTSAGSAGQPLLSGGGGASAQTYGTLGFAAGGTGLTALGSALQQLRVNAGATALEYFTPSAAVTPGGSTTNVQYNNAGAFGGNSGFVYDGSGTVGIGAFLNLGGTTTAGSAGFFNLASASQYGMFNAAVITPGSGVSASIYNQQGIINEAGSGTHTLLTGMNIVPPTINTGTATVTNTATLNITGPPTATVTGANYSLRVQAGKTGLGGALWHAYRAVSGNTGLDADTDYFLEVTANSPTITLPDATTTTGVVYHIINSGAGIAAVNTVSSQVIGNTGLATTMNVVAGASLSIVSSGSAWRIY